MGGVGYWVFLVGRLVMSVIVMYYGSDKSLGFRARVLSWSVSCLTMDSEEFPKLSYLIS